MNGSYLLGHRSVVKRFGRPIFFLKISILGQIEKLIFPAVCLFRISITRRRLSMIFKVLNIANCRVRVFCSHFTPQIPSNLCSSFATLPSKISKFEWLLMSHPSKFRNLPPFQNQHFPRFSVHFLQIVRKIFSCLPFFFQTKIDFVL